MNLYEIILNKRNGKELTYEEIQFVIDGYIKETVPDYQVSALLMAICCRGMNERETFDLTDIMTRSGETYDLTVIQKPTVDKHSTGGVGDGTSLALAPLLAAAGVTVPMICGRGLGHTGGTLDKLESIPGLVTGLTKEKFIAQLQTIGCAITGQTPNLVPADRKLYALRDVTATVDNIPLISSSIMSKKLAEGTNVLVLDVKVGNGAFMTTLDDAKILARMMVSIGKSAGRNVAALLTNMSQPLGYSIGNALEVEQTIKFLKNEFNDNDFSDLVYILGGWGLVLAGKVSTPEEGVHKLESLVSNGKPLEKFCEMIIAQGGDGKVVDKPQEVLPQAKFKKDIFSEKEGYISGFDTRRIGIAALELGAGRITKEAGIDPAVGIVLGKKIGDRIEKNVPLACMYYNDENKYMQGMKTLLSSVKISEQEPEDELRLVYYIERGN
ncbi:MAG: thymidine phosphorylase [Elusimicrobiota bacterium]